MENITNLEIAKLIGTAVALLLFLLGVLSGIAVACIEYNKKAKRDREVCNQHLQEIDMNIASLARLVEKDQQLTK